MNFIYFNILFFSLFLDTFISSHTNIPRTNNNNSKNAAVNKTPVNTIPDVITLDYIREQLKQIQLIKDEIIKDKLKKIKLLKKKYKNKNEDNDTKREIEKLEKEILDTKILCEDYIKNELKEISLLKDEIVNDKIEKYHWKRDKLIDYELNKLFLEDKRKKMLESYEQHVKEELEKEKMKEKILKEKKIKKKLKIEKFKNESIIYNIYLNMKYYLIEFRNDVIDIELACPKYFQDLFKKKKGKRKTFFELWTLFNEIMEEKVHKYQIGGYTMGIGIISGIAKSIHSLMPIPVVPAKKALCVFFISPDPATKVTAIIIIVILFIILLVFLYIIHSKYGILLKENLKKVITRLEDYYNSQEVLYII
ncbi:Plasmodium exported protein, unknown function [Plasmodium sp. gorilla clade G2]|uniref:Plasmodium exported protein, unknown function n=1 Tax=Plasmodium sp. gorilla clade G2 TaxID=880535 RepID=UPI000D220A20|nr:Plasmodium exported protein, unknown function [Plasmodium sp. gorilla clade G2]SOV10292.1 Plasmodium exported protein, unknown function [Plasmodium sp. gorilla clade G2]